MACNRCAGTGGATATPVVGLIAGNGSVTPTVSVSDRAPATVQPGMTIDRDLIIGIMLGVLAFMFARNA